MEARLPETLAITVDRHHRALLFQDGAGHRRRRGAGQRSRHRGGHEADADGRKLNPMYLFRVKTPGESRGEWDCYETLATILWDNAFRPVEAGDCPMLRT